MEPTHHKSEPVFFTVDLYVDTTYKCLPGRFSDLNRLHSINWLDGVLNNRLRQKYSLWFQMPSIFFVSEMAEARTWLCYLVSLEPEPHPTVSVGSVSHSPHSPDFPPAQRAHTTQWLTMNAVLYNPLLCVDLFPVFWLKTENALLSAYVCVFLIPLLQSGSRTVQPADVLFHAWWSTKRSCCC